MSQQAAIDALREIARLLERQGGDAYRARSFRRAAATIEGLEASEFEARVRQRRVGELPGIGKATAAVIADVAAGRRPAYLDTLESAAVEAGAPSRSSAARATDAAGAALAATVRGDCHVHSDWSDGRASIREMALAARALGREYIVLTDHSPRLTVARGLSAERLEEQLEVVAALNVELAPFRILTGIEVDILTDGSLDQTDELLARLDVVVASVHSLLRMEREPMTARLVAALANPHLDILGHCTGRMRRAGRDRPESTFDAELVFAAAEAYGKAIEVNARIERNDPPKRLITLAMSLGCRFVIDTDAHVPGELDWLVHGATRAAACGMTEELVLNTLGADDLLAWTGTHEVPR
jgi:putative hydrolase